MRVGDPNPGEPSRRRQGQYLLALGAYVALALILFGPQILAHPSSRILAKASNDPELFVWMLRWWPHALAHGLNPLYTHVVYAPTGINLAWTTAIPVPGVVMAPVTAALGPVVAFNVLALLAPATAAWGGYVLCRQITRAHLPSLAGGFVFGFSAYEWREQWGGHPNLTLVVLVPLCVALVVAHSRGRLRAMPFVALLGLGLAAEFLVSIEVFATLSLVGALAYSTCLIFAPRGRRRVLLKTAGLIALAYMVAFVLISPVLHAMVAYPRPLKHFPPLPFDLASEANPWTVFLSLVVPGRLVAGGSAMTHRLVGMDGLYLGVPTLAALVHLAVSKRRSPWVRAGAVLLPLVVLLAMGPGVKIAGRIVPLPWLAVRSLPLMGLAVPRRLLLFALLIAGTGLAVWLAAAPRSRIRWATVLVAAAFSLPNLVALLWSTDVGVPAFISSGAYRRYLSPGQIVLIADQRKGTQMLWQARSDMYFPLGAGFLGEAPPEFGNPRIPNLFRLPITHAQGEALRRYVDQHGVEVILISPAESPELEARLRSILGGRSVEAGNVDVLYLRPGPPRSAG
jgi:hypothetical protein